MRSGPWFAAFLVLVAVAPPATAATPGNGTVTASDGTVRAEDAGPGAIRIEVGNGSARMVVGLNFSLLSNLPGPGRLWIDAAGRLEGAQVVSVAAGLTFEGVGDPGQFLADPLSRFSIDVHSELDLGFATGVER